MGLFNRYLFGRWFFMDIMWFKKTPPDIKVIGGSTAGTCPCITHIDFLHVLTPLGHTGMLLILTHERAHGLAVSTSQDTVTSKLWIPWSDVTRNDSHVSQSSPWVSSSRCHSSPANFKVQQLPQAEMSASVPSVIQWPAGELSPGEQL